MPEKKLIITVILCTGAVVSLIYGITHSSVKKIIPVTAGASVSGSYSSGGKIPAKRLAKRSDFSGWGRSPFTAGKISGAAYSTLVLNGILWDEKEPKALISGSIVNRGDEIKGKRVIAINADSVVLNDGQKNIRLTLTE